MEDTRPGLIYRDEQSQEKISPDACRARTESPSRNTGRHEIGCDQVSNLLDVFDRYLPQSKHVSASCEREMMKYGMLYEVMEVAKLRFDGDSARWNGTPNPARDYDK